ncbi:PAS domain S-box-containing protein [Dethiosulfatibacter aminovorans DSM 17477]|uniref:PAS domain S-box-containing protein n=1 Tax=Dethiosulfatibacter aminovorans DSM 17477 TaxID=1121476 RepID=A0A1M6J593_9FIRM|nr:sigma 54-interacting transcriptional regulator [Dethiosulfatibacter aminovorans]SHJ41799.1 PAS domain S-box-containing protein [Dethiosulfatibacter aminovorans DSM 17477]
MTIKFNDENKEVFEYILDNIPDAITVVDTDLNTVFFNKTSEEYFDVKKEDIIGKDLRDVFPSSLLPKVIESEKSFFDIYNSPREKTYTIISAIPLYDKEGNLIGGLSRDRDITEYVKLSDVLSKTQNSLAELEKELSATVNMESYFSNIISNNAEFIKRINLCKNISRTPMNILLNGESGTGKELFSKAVHYESGRKGNFVAVNCSAIPEELFESELFGYEGGAFTGANKKGKPGKFEEANNGTLFLDEIGDMPVSLQPKILRILEDGYVTRIGSNKKIEIDVRIVSATNKNLKEAVNDGSFRKDLYYRLNTFQIGLIPLRERKEDIVLLANKFLQQICMENRMNIIEIPNEILAIFKRHSWEGNVRELRNIMQRCVLLAKESNNEKILVEFLPDYLQEINIEEEISIDYDSFSEGIEDYLEKIEKEIISKTLARFNYNKKKTAEHLRMPRSNLYYKIEKYGL